jgi:hypothetical protein
MATTVIALIALLLAPEALAIGPNFYLQINASLIGYSAIFNVSPGSSVFDLDQAINSYTTNPGGDEFYFGDTASGSGGTLQGVASTEIWWAPGLDDDDLTQASHAHTYLTLNGSTTSSGTAACNGLAATGSCGVYETGVRVSETSWQTALGYCEFETHVGGVISNGGGGVSSNITWGPAGGYADVTSTWTSGDGYSTQGFYMIEGVPEEVDDSSSGLTATATVILGQKESPSPRECR